MVGVNQLSLRIHEICDILHLLETQIAETGERLQPYLSPPHPILISDWKNLISAASSVALLADEILNPTPSA